jgi:hypothetical protein
MLSLVECLIEIFVYKKRSNTVEWNGYFCIEEHQYEIKYWNFGTKTNMFVKDNLSSSQYLKIFNYMWQ